MNDACGKTIQCKPLMVAGVLWTGAWYIDTLVIATWNAREYLKTLHYENLHTAPVIKLKLYNEMFYRKEQDILRYRFQKCNSFTSS